MPKRTDISKILILGSGPIVIGQSAEFDYSGTQACKALKSEGFEVVLANSNPATIMTDPESADRTYIEPLTREYLEEIIRVEREMSPSAGFAILPTVGGQTALNLAIELADSGVLDKYNVSLIGAQISAIKKAEDRLFFKDAMQRIGLDVPKSALVNNLKDGIEFAGKIGFPVIIRPSFTLGGTGGGIAYNREELMEVLARGLDLSPVHECLIEESVLGWKEYELEVMRDTKDNVIIICSIENFDPMGVHTGDSITVAPAQTLTDREYQMMRDASIAVIREIGVETGGSNIQFGVNPSTGRMVVIEMNPRVSRSSALASKATGFPIAKIAAKLAVGYTLDEIPNDITRKTPACFEPTLDYVVVKIPKWQFEKFPGADESLGPQMKSVGEVMAIGRTFKEALQKGIRALDTGKRVGSGKIEPKILTQRLVTPHPERLTYVQYAIRQGHPIKQIAKMTSIDPWFLYQLKEINDLQLELEKHPMESVPTEVLREAKRMGFSDGRLAGTWRLDGKGGQEQIRHFRKKHGLKPVYKRVDTCAAEFESYTPYLYSTYEEEDEAAPSVVELLGGQAGLATPLIFLFCVSGSFYALFRGWKRQEPRWLLLGAITAPVFVFFLLHAAGQKIQPNWPGFIYPAAILAGVHGFLALSKEHEVKRWIGASFRLAPWLGIAFTLGAFVQLGFGAIPLKASRDPTSRLKGWSKLGADISALARAEGAAVVLTDRYAITGELAFYGGNGLPVLQINERIRYANFPAPNEAQLTGGPALLILRRGGDASRAAAFFESARLVATLTREAGFHYRDAYVVHLLTGYRGGLFQQGIAPSCWAASKEDRACN